MYTHRFLSVIALVGALGILTACDNPVEEGGDDHEGAEAAGVILSSGEEELVRVLNLEISDTLFVPVGEEVDIEVEFLDDHGDPIHTEDFGDEISMQVEVQDGAVAAASTTGPWSFSIDGQQIGETTLAVKLFHVDHEDFTTPEIPVVVE